MTQMKKTPKDCNFGGGKGTMKLYLVKGQGQGNERTKHCWRFQRRKYIVLKQRERT
jgi:hypothetical protein